MAQNNNADIELLATLDVDSSEPEILRAIRTLENRLKRRKDGKIKIDANIDEAKIKSVLDKLQGILRNKKLSTDTKSSVEAISKEATAMLEVVQAAKKASVEKREFEKANKKVEKSADSTANAINRERTAMQSLDDIDYMLNNIVMNGQRGNSVFRQFGNTLRDMFYAFAAVNLLQQATYKMVNAGKEGIEVIKSFDDLNIDLQLATGEDKDYVKGLIADYADLGNELGTLTKGVAESADTFLRQGRSIEDTNQLIEDSIILSKVAKTDNKKASEILTATINGFQLAASEGSRVNDILTSIDLNSASDASGLGESLTKVASIANNAGVSLEKTAAMIATIKDVTQSDDAEIGTSLKTILSRMASIRAGKFIDEESGEALNDVEKVLGKIKISMRDVNGIFKESEVIIDEVGTKWKTLDKNTQNAIGSAMGGVYQANKIVSLFDNYDKVIKLTKVAEESAGTALKKFNDSYLPSLEAKTNALKNSLTDLATTTIPDSLYGSVLDTSKTMVDLVNDTGVLKGLLTGLGSSAVIYTFSQLTHFLGEATQGFANFNEALNMTQNGTVAIQDMQRLIDLTGGLSQSQTRLLLSSQSLADAQRIAVLMNQGLSREEAVLQIQTWGVATAQNGATAATVTFAGALRGLWATLLANPLVLITMAVTAGVTAFNSINHAIEEHKRKLKETAQEASKQAEESSNIVSELLKLKTQLDDGTKSADELTSAFEEQLRAMGWTETEVDNLITKYNGLTGAIDEATRKALENARTNAHTDVATSSKSLEAEYDGSSDIIGQDSTIEGLGRGMSGSGNAELDEQIREILNSKGFMYDPGNNWYRAKDDSAASIYEYYQGLQEIVQLMQQTASETNDNAILDSYLYKDVRDAVDQLSESANLYGDAISRLHNADAQLELADYLKTNSIGSKEAFDEYINAIKNSSEYSDEYKLVLIEVANNAFHQFSRVTETATENTSDMATAVKDANTTLSTLQSKLDELKSAQDEYNSTGSITAETMQKLIDNDLLQYLDFSSGKLKINTEALLAEGEAAKVNAIQMLQDAMTTDLMLLATGKLTEASPRAQTAVANLGNSAETTGNQAETAAGKLAWFAIAAQAAKDGAEGDLTGMSVEDFNTQADAIISAYMNAANSIGSVTIKSPKTSGSSSSGSTKNEALDNYLDSIERTYKYHEDELRYINDLQYAYDKLAKSAEDREEILDKINGAQKDYTENQIKDLEHANELLENQGLKGNDAYIANLEKIKQLNHEAAESYRELLRGMGYNDETIEKIDFIQTRQKGWYDADNQIKDVLQNAFDDKINDLEHKIQLLENRNEQEEHYGDDSTRLTRYNRTQEINDYYKQLQEEVHKQAEELRKQGYPDDMDEIQELQNKWWEFENAIRDNVSAMTDLKISAYTEQLEDEIEALDLQYEKESAIIDALKQQNDLKKQIRDKQAELNAELDASKHTEEWLDEETRKLLFNEEDYSELSEELSKIDSEVNRLYRNYRNEINRLGEDEWYKQEEITSQFQARLDVQMESYELLEKELEIAKKRTEYENIAKQRNTRVMVAGQWIMTPDVEKLREASKSLATLKNEKENLEITNAENATIRGMEAINNATNTERLAIQNRVDMIEEMTELERNAYAERLPDSVLEGARVNPTVADAPKVEVPVAEKQNIRYTGIDENGKLISEPLSEGYSRIADMPQSVLGKALLSNAELVQRIVQTAPNYTSMIPSFVTPTIPNIQHQNTSNVTQYTFTGDISVENPIGDPNDLVYALATQAGQTFDVTKNMKY